MLNYRGTVARMLYSFQVRVHKELNPGRAWVLLATIGANPPIFNVSLWNSKTAGDLPDDFSPLRRCGVLKWEGDATELFWLTERHFSAYLLPLKQGGGNQRTSKEENKCSPWKLEAKDDLFSCSVAGQLPPLLEGSEHSHAPSPGKSCPAPAAARLQVRSAALNSSTLGWRESRKPFLGFLAHDL